MAIANLTDTSVDLSWTDNTSGNASYIVEWRETGASSWSSATTSAGVVSYQLTGLSPATDYEWQVTADCGSYWLYKMLCSVFFIFYPIIFFIHLNQNLGINISFFPLIVFV